MNIKTKKLVLSGMFLAICLLLPFLTGQIPQIGSVLAPMHIPVLICGIICGWPYGLVVGFIAPILRYAIFGMPPIFPTGVAMAFELAAYGAVAGVLYHTLPKKTIYLFGSLLAAMFAGRIVWGITRFVIAGLFQIEFSFSMFLAGAFVTAIPGIICHIIVVPAVVIALKKTGLIFNE